MGDLARSIGEAIRWHRERLGMKQLVLAGLARITFNYLSKVERGERVPALDVLERIAVALKIPLTALLERPAGGGTGPTVENPAIPEIRDAIMRMPPGLNHGGGAPDLVALREQLNIVYAGWLGSKERYSLVGRWLPDLIRQAERGTRAFPQPAEAHHRRFANQVAADVYCLLREFARWVGRVDLAVLAADRAIRNAEAAEDPIRLALSQWQLGHALLAEDELEGAEDVALTVAESIRPGMRESRELTALYGAMHQVAVKAAAQRGDRSKALRYLEDIVEPTAEAVGEVNLRWTLFGPVSVGLYALRVAAECGAPDDGIRIARRIDLSHVALIQRRAIYHVDLARCHDMLHQDQAVLMSLKRAEEESPQDVGCYGPARNLVGKLLGSSRYSGAEDVLRLADRAGLINLSR